LPFRRPEPFPQNSLLGARVALVGLAEAWGEDFCEGLYRAQFGGSGRRIDDPATVTDILSGLNIDGERVLATAQSDKIKSQLRAQTGEAERLGVFGAPSFITTDGELFWGNDRLERALRWAKQGH
jgi:2-hydroxychromene-2-carboxylate isomerase